MCIWVMGGGGGGYFYTGLLDSGIATGGWVVWSSRAAESKERKTGRQNKYFKYKDFDLPRSSDFKLPSEIEGN
jgi:hypothetical protein